MGFKEKHVGCSGFFYKDWKGKFYPEDLPQRLWLEYYAEEFSTVEINNTFYHLPKNSTFEQWYKRTPPHFRFAVKGSRYVTHIKRLKDPDSSLTMLYDATSLLKEKLSCILWQLPPSLKKDMPLLENFGKACSKNIVNVIEFRHLSWFDEEVYELMEKQRLAYCMISAPGNFPEEVKQTSNQAAYLRFHGKTDWYRYLYSDEELMSWNDRLKKLTADNFYVFFNNDYDANAIVNARKFKEMLQ